MNVKPEDVQAAIQPELEEWFDSNLGIDMSSADFDVLAAQLVRALSKVPLAGGSERAHVICVCPDCVKPRSSIEAAQVLAHLDALKDDAAAHIMPSDLVLCQTSECVVQVCSVRFGNPDETSVPLFSREQVAEALGVKPGESNDL